VTDSVLTDDEAADAGAAPGPEPKGPGTEGTRLGGAAADGPGRRSIHRLRDLDRAGRTTAAILAAALLVAPVVALIHYLPDWVPTQDPAMMALRALDVGTSRTPLVGQPSLAHLYIDSHTVHHLGPIHFYLLAPFVRVFGAQTGMLLVSVLLTGTCLLIAAWAVFRQLGAAAGVLAAVILGAVTYTTGASSLVNPVSSNMAGYPLLCSAVLLWCLMCGDLCLLPLTTAVVSFTAQQHLSVLPALGVMTIAGAVGLLLAVVRAPEDGRPSRRSLLRWGGVAAGIAGVMWLPVVVQQLFGTTPNLSRVATFAISDDRATLGYGAGLRQVVHVLGLPPVLGQDNINAYWLNRTVPLVTWLTAGAVVAAAVVAALAWRRTRPRRALLVVMAGVLVAAGLVNGSSVPTGTYETYRLAFYHWIFPLTFVVVLVLALAAFELITRLPIERRAAMRVGSIAVAVLAIAAPNVVNAWQDRWLNSLSAAFSPIDRDTVDQLTDQVMAHRDDLDGPVVLIARGQSRSWGFHQALALALEERGVRVEQPGYEAMFVAEDRWGHRSTARTGLVLILDTRATEDLNILTLPSTAQVIADVRVPEDFDREAFETLGRLPEQPRRLRVFVLDREELLDWSTDEELFD
jgi:hypothetical protein